MPDRYSTLSGCPLRAGGRLLLSPPGSCLRLQTQQQQQRQQRNELAQKNTQPEVEGRHVVKVTAPVVLATPKTPLLLLLLRGFKYNMWN